MVKNGVTIDTKNASLLYLSKNKTREEINMEKINKVINIIKENKWIHYAIIVVIGIVLSIPLGQIQIRDTHDGFLHLLRMIGTNNALKIGEIPPIVAPYYCNGGGYAMNLFYNPLVTYVPLLIKLFTSTYAMALKVFGGLCIVLSGITMYHFVRQVTNKRSIALFASIIYLIAPYKLGDVYKRFAIGEFASFIFMPLLFIGMYNLFNQDGKKHYFITIGATGLLLTHTITTFYMAIFCAIYILLNIEKLKNINIIKKITINVIFILLISMFFIAPMLEAKQSAEYSIFDSNIMSTNGNYVYKNTIELSEFFVDIGKENATTYIIGVPTFILMCLTIFTYRKVDKKYKDMYIVAIIFSIISMFMCTKYCPWFVFPDFMCKLQYPWRLMGFFAFFISFVAGVNIYVLLKILFDKNITRLIVVTAIIILSVAYTVPIVKQYKTDDFERDNKRESSVLENPYIYHMSINRDYLPKKALYLQYTYLKDKEDRIYIIQGNASVTNEEKKDLTVTATIDNISANTVIEFPFFYYPGYEIIIEQDGNKIKLDSVESDNGFVSTVIENEVETCRITAKYVGTKITYVSYIISLTSLIIFVIYVINEKNKVKMLED